MKPHTRSFNQVTNQMTFTPTGKPIVSESEGERAAATLVIRQMTPEERERYGPPVPRGGKPMTWSAKGRGDKPA